MPDPDIIAEGRKTAIDYLTERGIAVLDHDWDSSDGTIPIVAEERGVLVVEVVVRTGPRYGPASGARFPRGAGRHHRSGHG